MLQRLPGLGGEELEFDDQELDMRAVGAGQRGHCHSLALAIHQRTGWPLVGIQDRGGQLAHVAICTPEGELLDASGCWDLGDLVEEYAGWRDPDCTVALSADTVQALGHAPGWRMAQPDAFAGLVGLVLQYHSGSLANLPSPLDSYCLQEWVGLEPSEDRERSEPELPPLQLHFLWRLRQPQRIEVRVRLHRPEAEEEPRWHPLPGLQLAAAVPVSAISEAAFQGHIERYLQQLDRREVQQACE